MCINETFNSYMILNNVIGSIHHYHNILFVIVCQSWIHNLFCVPYLLDQMPWLVLISPINFVQLLFKSGDYPRASFISLSQSLRWHGREQSSIERLLDRQRNLLVAADWFTSLFWVCFTSSQQVFTCARATHASIHHAHHSYYLRVAFILFSICAWRCGYILFESCY